MKSCIPLLIVLSFIIPSITSAQLLDFQIRAEQDGEIISEMNWKNMTNYPSRVLVAQRYDPNGTLSINLGSELDSITQKDGDSITYTNVLRVRELNYTIGNPEEEFVASFNTREFFFAGKIKVGEKTVFETEDGVKIEFSIKEAQMPQHRSFKNRKEFNAFLESLNEEGFSIESPPKI
ncbi:hypothetical protein [Puniceicoccus vermicola]|uniref:Uncharacterized protein n=1 Tax=Puniceicoccus vermicola TaxID=388746 RepID=A0A7X1AVR3_9BACT|nr:hypothetical protein [Puniceicoccus vermicola]MBC2600779.1 hypothetical protein [Puniceicoccus vermicola]